MSQASTSHLKNDLYHAILHNDLDTTRNLILDLPECIDPDLIEIPVAHDCLEMTMLLLENGLEPCTDSFDTLLKNVVKNNSIGMAHLLFSYGVYPSVRLFHQMVYKLKENNSVELLNVVLANKPLYI